MAFETYVRLGSFLTILAVLIAWERLAQRRPLSGSRPFRWTWNFLMVVVDTLCIRVLAAVWTAGVAVGAAHWAQVNNHGLLNLLEVPPWIAVLSGALVLDFAIYSQHVMFHKVPLLWRLHKVHHSDVAIDVSTALRFHPIEILLSMLIKVGIVVLLGIPVLGVVLFEVILNGMAMFNHANIRLAPAVDHWLRRLVVTPDMHRVHHSVYPDETDSNYGFNLSCWDRLCRTYRPEPRDGHMEMRIGLREYPDGWRQHLGWMLLLPFLRPPRSAVNAGDADQT